MCLLFVGSLLLAVACLVGGVAPRCDCRVPQMVAAAVLTARFLSRKQRSTPSRPCRPKPTTQTASTAPTSAARASAAGLLAVGVSLLCTQTPHTAQAHASSSRVLLTMPLTSHQCLLIVLTCAHLSNSLGRHILRQRVVFRGLRWYLHRRSWWQMQRLVSNLVDGTGSHKRQQAPPVFTRQCRHIPHACCWRLQLVC